MGDDIGLGSVTDCRLRSFCDHRQHTQQCRAAPLQKSKQIQPQPMSSPINYVPSLTLTNLLAKICATLRSKSEVILITAFILDRIPFIGSLITSQRI